MHREIGIIVIDDSVPVVSCIAKNTLEVPPDCAQDLFYAQPEGVNAIWEKPADVTEDGKLCLGTFGIWHDWLRMHPHMLQVLLNYNVGGTILFCDVQPGLKLWGYSFDGQGGYIPMVGAVMWGPDLRQ